MTIGHKSNLTHPRIKYSSEERESSPASPRGRSNYKDKKKESIRIPSATETLRRQQQLSTLLLCFPSVPLHNLRDETHRWPQLRTGRVLRLILMDGNKLGIAQATRAMHQGNTSITGFRILSIHSLNEPQLQQVLSQVYTRTCTVITFTFSTRAPSSWYECNDLPLIFFSSSFHDSHSKKSKWKVKMEKKMYEYNMPMVKLWTNI